MTTAEFTRQYSSIEAYLYRFALKLTKSEFAAKDLVQETGYKAFSKKDTFQKKSSFKSWICTIMFHGFVSAYRKEKRRRNYNQDLAALLAYPAENTTSNKGYEKLIHEDVIHFLDELNPKVKSTFALHIQGYQYNEIGDILGIPTGTVKSRINFARNKAKRKIVIDTYQTIND